MAVYGCEATNMAIENNDDSSGNDTDLSQDETKARKAKLHAQRMRLHRKRLRRGERLVRILLCAPEMESLVHRGYLDNQSRNDQAAIQEAVELFVSDALFEAVTRNVG